MCCDPRAEIAKIVSRACCCCLTCGLNKNLHGMRRYCVVGVIQAQGSCRACYFCCGGGGSCVFYEVYERDQSARATNKAR
ncbi:Protein of unknown function [Pyronema omphalodes CBS 100304]|uniref:Uncharacterized protein n=1 Tax=Pyronema omphalodes (strain CBS 100304) TaxID=1076935 RepID=U4L3L5_PYROM|nr:Protein of unknown function [Pyronema omphalodes CBS 100304]CCX11340.1 Protein of unknown function [Pyronema omphalodes CBS 100304]